MKKQLGLGLSLLASVLLAGCAKADPYELPGDCGIIATEAYSRLAAATPWCRMMSFRIMFIDQKRSAGHMVVVWQAETGGNVFVYDRQGTINLHTHSQNPKDILAAMQRLCRPAVRLESPTFES